MIPEHVKVIATQTVPPYIVSLCDDGILYVRVTNQVVETVETSKKLVKAIGTMVNGKKVPMLSQFDEFVLPSKENRNFWAEKDSNPYTIAEAFITNSTAMTIIANFYLRIEKPQRETKMFTKVEDARKWLKTFL